MCDEQILEEMTEYLNRTGKVTRRELGAFSAGAGLAMMLPHAANAQSVTETDVEIRTPDGVADCYFVHPSSGTHPGVVVWPDILGLRPAFRQMGRRLAESGYSVLVVNPFYRGKRAPVVRRALRRIPRSDVESHGRRKRRQCRRAAPRHHHRCQPRRQIDLLAECGDLTAHDAEWDVRRGPLL